MILQALQMAMVLVLTFQMMLFVLVSPTTSLRVAYADSWRKTGTVIAHLFQIQHGPEQWIGVAAFGLIGFYVTITAALDIVARFAH
jgi:multisubunit Na+/H+ antiporter MnhF subunit